MGFTTQVFSYYSYKVIILIKPHCSVRTQAGDLNQKGHPETGEKVQLAHSPCEDGALSCSCPGPPHGGSAYSDLWHKCCGSVQSLQGWDGQQGSNSQGKARANLSALLESPGSRKGPPFRSQGSQRVFR